MLSYVQHFEWWQSDISFLVWTSSFQHLPGQYLHYIQAYSRLWMDGTETDLQQLLLLLLKELLLDAVSLDMGFVWGQDCVG